MVVLVNRAKMTTATTGTGTITLGSASAGYQTFADAGVGNGDSVRYTIEDGANWEVGTGTYTASGTTLSRSVIESSNSDAAISLSGSATVFVTATATDLNPDIAALAVTDGNFIVGNGTEWVAESGATVRTSLGLGASDNPQFATIELGAASDTTISRTGAGVIAVEGVEVTTNTATQTLTNKTLTSPTINTATLSLTGAAVEDIYAIPSSTTPAIDPGNGSIQTWTLTGNSTPTDSLAAGEAITLMIDDGSAYTITWTSLVDEWIGGSAPTLATTGYSVVVLWKVSTTVYANAIGDLS